jgi:hypothetical protein
MTERPPLVHMGAPVLGSLASANRLRLHRPVPPLPFLLKQHRFLKVRPRASSPCLHRAPDTNLVPRHCSIPATPSRIMQATSGGSGTARAAVATEERRYTPWWWVTGETYGHAGESSTTGQCRLTQHSSYQGFGVALGCACRTRREGE